MKKPLIALALLTAALLAACGTETVEVEVTREVEVEVETIREVEVRIEVEVTRLVEVEVTRIVEVEVVADAPEPASEPAPAPSGAAFDPKQADVYLAGVEIGPGIWRSSGEGGSDGNCDLTIRDLNGDLTDWSWSPPGALIRIPAGEFQVEIDDDNCTWTYFSE